MDFFFARWKETEKNTPLISDGTTNQTEAQQTLVFSEKGKQEYLRKPLSDQSTEPTNSTRVQCRTRAMLVESECSHH